jgi:tRNA-specific adenosine deaminase 1
MRKSGADETNPKGSIAQLHRQARPVDAVEMGLGEQAGQTVRGWKGRRQWFADKLQKLVIEEYKKLPKRGKPQGNEWTVLAAIVALRESKGGEGDLEVVTIATGNKCLGQSKLCEHGTVVNDSHAEILARRALKLLLWDDLRLHLKGGNGTPTLLEPYDGRHGESSTDGNVQYEVPEGVSLHLYISETPCGDASIIVDPCALEHTKGGGDDGIRKLTGAKRVGKRKHLWSEHDKGTSFLRTKSGRSDLKPCDRTTSMSCSDKIVSWCFGGLQGALLSRFMKPIFLSSVTVEISSNDRHAALLALERAVTNRAKDAMKPFEIGQKRTPVQSYLPPAPPVAMVCSPLFHDSMSEKKKCLTKNKCGVEPRVTSCGYAAYTIWPQKRNAFTEVLIANRGKKQGASKKVSWENEKTWSKICKASFLKRFRGLVPVSNSVLQSNGAPLIETYCALKCQSEGYYEAKNALLNGPFHEWLRMPDAYLQFS